VGQHVSLARALRLTKPSWHEWGRQIKTEILGRRPLPAAASLFAADLVQQPGFRVVTIKMSGAAAGGIISDDPLPAAWRERNATDAIQLGVAGLAAIALHLGPALLWRRRLCLFLYPSTYPSSFSAISGESR